MLPMAGPTRALGAAVPEKVVLLEAVSAVSKDPLTCFDSSDDGTTCG